ncbi:MAG: DUF4276 family protein [Pirellulaceae bacterium]|nr:DUF4276 family protein [Pirellulaceae bacterium]
MIVFLTEEESMKAALETLISRTWPAAIAGVNWIVLSFQGKSDLEKNIVPKMKSWRYGAPHFVILRDQDGSDCEAVKAALCQKAEQGGRPFTVRVVCNELESWFLGELDAVELAYPKSNASSLKAAAKLRVPDSLTNACQELEKLVQTTGKVGRATAIAKFFAPARCTSNSFQVFWKTAMVLMDS